MTRTMYFLGVSTGSSAAIRLFPSWATELGVDANLVGIDLPLRAAPEHYRRAVERIRDDPDAAGALVTSHKVDLYAAAGALFSGVDRYARQCGEISCVVKRNGSLEGFAKDPVTAVRALESLLGPGYFARSGGHVLCLGAGGAGTAITSCLLTRDDRPDRIVLTDSRAERLAAAREAVERFGTTDATVDYLPTASGDRPLTDLPNGSLVINATGLGKDQPGSPLTDTARFPYQAVVWDLNYRGKLDFLRQAERHAAERGLTVVDGWEYFLHGWSEHICTVFDVPWTVEAFTRFEAASPRTANPRPG